MDLLAPVQEYVNGFGAIVPFGHKGNFLVSIAVQPSPNEASIQRDGIEVRREGAFGIKQFEQFNTNGTRTENGNEFGCVGAEHRKSVHSIQGKYTGQVPDT